MLTTRFQPKVQAATSCRRAARSRVATLRVVAFKNGDEEQQAQKQELGKAKVTFQLPLHVEYGQEVALVGASECLGAWDVERSIPMCWNDGDMWTAQAELPTDTPIEYKYVIRAGEGEVKAVVQWQPCNNLELQAAAEQAELTIRDAWEGEQHDVLPGTLPLPPPPAPEEPQPEPEAAAPAEGAATELVAPAPAVIEAAAAAPEPAAVVEPANVVIEEPAVVPAAPAVVVAEAAVAPVAAAAKEERKPESPAAAVAATSARRRSSTTSRAANGSKPAGGNSTRANKVVAAASTTEGAPQVKYGSLTTNELKEVCKERGLSTKGQRRDLLARLQQLLGRNNNKA